MKKHSRKLLVFLIIAVIIGSGIYSYKNMKLTKAFTYFPQIINTAKEKLSSKGEDIFNKTAKDFKNNAFARFKSGINTSVDKIGKIIGAEPIILSGDNNQSANIMTSQINQEINKNCQ